MMCRCNYPPHNHPGPGGFCDRPATITITFATTVKPGDQFGCDFCVADFRRLVPKEVVRLESIQ